MGQIWHSSLHLTHLLSELISNQLLPPIHICSMCPLGFLHHNHNLLSGQQHIRLISLPK